MKKPELAASALVLVGALNWGLVGIAEFDLVAWILGGMDFGETSVVSRIVYSLVGVAAVYGIASLMRARRHTGVRPIPADAR